MAAQQTMNPEDTKDVKIHVDQVSQLTSVSLVRLFQNTH
jgi:hypothetical protein